MIEHPVSCFSCSKQPHLMEFHHKRPNGCIRSVSEILFQLLCGKLLCTISRQNILPEQPFFFCDFSFRKSSLIYLKISFRRDCIHLQAVIDLIAEVEQKGSHIRIAGNQSISLHAFVGFVICALVFSDVSRKRREQCRRIALLNKIPEVK